MGCPACNQLQWGLTLSSKETMAIHIPDNMQPEASMGPYSFEQGNQRLYQLCVLE